VSRDVPHQVHPAAQAGQRPAVQQRAAAGVADIDALLAAHRFPVQTVQRDPVLAAGQHEVQRPTRRVPAAAMRSGPTAFCKARVSVVVPAHAKVLWPAGVSVA